MAFKNGAFATLWNVDKSNQLLIKFNEKYADISVSTSKKNKDGQYENDFVGKVRCFGHAFEVLKTYAFAEKDKVKLLEVEVSNKYNASSKTTYVTYTCWDLEPVGNPAKQPPKQPEVMPDLEPLDDMGSGDGLPF